MEKMDNFVCTKSYYVIKSFSKSRKILFFFLSFNLAGTLVLFINCLQCLSLMAGFCSSATALKDVSIFFTVASNETKVSHDLISLSRANYFNPL